MVLLLFMESNLLLIGSSGLQAETRVAQVGEVKVEIVNVLEIEKGGKVFIRHGAANVVLLLLPLLSYSLVHSLSQGRPGTLRWVLFDLFFFCSRDDV